MAFGVGEGIIGADAGIVRGRQVEIACDCWFTSSGRTMPMLVKFVDTEGQVKTLRNIKVEYMEEKQYSGISSLEYCCSVAGEEQISQIRLIFYKEECKWVMIL